MFDHFPEPIRSQLNRDLAVGMAEAVMDMARQREGSPMSDERLAEREEQCCSLCFLTEARLDEIGAIAEAYAFDQAEWVVGDDRVGTETILWALIAEVRRLRRALQLSEASRGVPSPVVGD